MGKGKDIDQLEVDRRVNHMRDLYTKKIEFFDAENEYLENQLKAQKETLIAQKEKYMGKENPDETALSLMESVSIIYTELDSRIESISDYENIS